MNVLIWVAGPMHVRQRRERKALFVRGSTCSCWFLFFLFTIALWPARFVTNVHVQASGQESIVRSSPLIESLIKWNVRTPQVVDTSRRWNNSASRSTASEKDERLVAADMDGAPLRLPKSALSEYCQRSRNVVNDNQLLVELWSLR